MLTRLLSSASRLALSAGLALAAVTALTLPTSDAFAQGGGGGRGPGGGMFGGMGNMFGMGGGRDFLAAPVTTRDIDRAAEILGLDNSQKEAARAILEGLQEQYNAEAEKFRDAQQKARDEARDSGDWTAMGKIMREGTEKITKKRTEVETTFNSELKGLCTTEQAARWSKYERAQRRETRLDNGFISGERVNLVTIVDKLELKTDAKAAVAPVLEQYEIDLDREIVARTKAQEELMSEGQKMMEGFDFQSMQNPDFLAKANKLLERGRSASVRLRDVNKRFAREIEAKLPDDKKVAFTEQVQKLSFPQVYRATRTGRQLDAAVGFGDLTAEQKTSIAEMRDVYNRELAAVNAKLAAQTEKDEMEFTVEKMMNFMRQDDASPMGELRKKKNELNNSTEEKIKNLLNPEQVKRLPTGGDDGGGPGGPGGRGGPGGGRGGAGGAPGGGNDNNGQRRQRGGGGGGGGGF